MEFTKSFESHQDLIDELGTGNAYLVWALALYLDYPDLFELAAEALTDGSNDKKIDFIRIDPDSKRLVFAQGYFSEKTVDQAPANKASDLNTAAAWLFSGDLDKVPENLREIMQEARDAIDSGDIEQIELLYVHNLPESVNVAHELQTAAQHLRASLPDSEAVTVVHRELGVENVERLYVSKESTLLVREDIVCPAQAHFEESGPKWKALIVSLPGAWLREQFLKHGEDLFSANYRGFLGITKRRKINSGIRQSAESSPDDFWVLNNGITILTNDATPRGKETVLSGMSIINGAQTTGSIGSTDSTKYPLSDVRIMCRIIVSNDPEVIKRVIKFNNTQNEITTWDQYSNSPDQKRIAQEFADLGHSYSLKRGYEASNSELGIEVVAQPLIALEGSFREANRGKNSVFESGSMYRQAFELKKARHVLFAYAIARAVDARRIELKKKDASGKALEVEKAQLALFRSLRFKYFFLSVVGGCLEQILAEKVDLAQVAFTPDYAKSENRSLNDLIALCLPVVSMLLAYMASVLDEDLSAAMKRTDAVAHYAKLVNSLVYASLVGGVTPPVEAFREAVSASG